MKPISKKRMSAACDRALKLGLFADIDRAGDLIIDNTQGNGGILEVRKNGEIVVRLVGWICDVETLFKALKPLLKEHR